MSTPVLELNAVDKSFGSLAAVDGVDLAVSENELVAIVGPSGCGKSTLLRLIAGLAHIDAGEIRIGGRIVDDGVRRVDPEARHTGLVFQEHALFPHLTVAQNITFGLRNDSRAERERRCGDWLEVVGLPGLGRRYPHELSGGERQRVALARALAPQPRLMLLDEPFASLDPNLRSRLRRDIVDILHRTRTPALFVTHDQADALTTGDRIAVMRQGHIEQIGQPDEVFHRPVTRFVAGFLGEATFLRVDLAGHSTELGPLPSDQPVAAGAELVVRPDDVAIATDASAPGVKATVVAVEFHGPTRTYTLRLPSGTDVLCTQQHDIVLELGSEVMASVVPGHHALISGESTR
jgi:iron(III) transport system ATP-binding protein